MILGAQLQKQARRQETFTTVIRLPGQTLTKSSKSRWLILCSCDPANPMAKAIWNWQTTQSHLRLWGHAVNAEGRLKRSDLAVRSSGQGNLVSSVVPPLCFYWRFILCLCLVFLHLLFYSFKPKPLALFFFFEKFIHVHNKTWSYLLPICPSSLRCIIPLQHHAPSQ